MDYLSLIYQPKQTKAGHEDLLDCHRWTPSLLTENFFLISPLRDSVFFPHLQQRCNYSESSSAATTALDALPPLITLWH
jgi:hypothetical protein